MKALVSTVAAALALAVVPAVAAGYPQYQFSSETATCGECHHASAGAGLLTDWGRSELGDTLSMGGDGRLLHSIDEPAWLAVGGDLRVAALVNDTGSADGAEVAVFPMQLDLAARVAADRVAVTLVAGVRSAARDSDTAGDGGGGARALGFISREHFVTYESNEATWQVRGGRFAAPFGLRLADHTAYVRRYTGHGLYEETYGVGWSRLQGATDLHVTGFVSDVVQLGAPPVGGAAAMLERRWATSALIVSARVTGGADDVRGLADVAVKRWLAGPKLLLMGEVAAGYQYLREAAEGRPQIVGYAGPVWFPTRGINLALAAEVYAADVRLAEDNRYAGSAVLSVMPIAHVELLLNARYQRIGTDAHAAMAMFQLHYLP